MFNAVSFSRARLMLLGLVLLAVLSLSGTNVLSGWAMATLPAQDAATPIQVQLKMDRLPLAGETALVQCEASTVRPAPATRVEIVLPAAATMTGGAATWSGSLQPGAPQVLKAIVRFGDLGNTQVSCRAHYQLDKQNSWGDLESLYFNVGRTASKVGFEQDVNLAGEYENDGEGLPVQTPLAPPPSRQSRPAPPAPPAMNPDERDSESLAPEAPAGLLTITGTWKYYNRQGKNVPAKYFLIELTDGNYNHLAYCWTNSKGKYTCPSVPNPGPIGVRTMLVSYVGYEPSPNQLQVVDPACGVVNYTCAYYTSTDPRVYGDGKHNIGTWYVMASSWWRMAYWLKDDLDRAWTYIWKVGGKLTPVETGGSSTILWNNYSVDGTYYSFGGQIHLKAIDSNSHDTAIHEYGHNVMWNNHGSWVNECPPTHYVNAWSGQHCAWTEGWGDFLALAVNNDPSYHWGDGGTLNLETPTWSTPNFDVGDGVEGRVAGAMWDMIDGKKDGYDRYKTSFKNIWDVYYHGVFTGFNGYWLSWIARGHGTKPLPALYQNTIDY